MERTELRALLRILPWAFAAFLSTEIASPSVAEEAGRLREDFTNLDNWKPFRFPNISEHTTYTIVREDDNGLLKMETDCSASGIVCKTKFAVRDHPNLRWRWKVENVYLKGDARTKAGDDFPVRLYVLFECPKDAGFFARRRAKAARRLYGDVPVYKALCYVWSSRRHSSKIVANAYTGEVKMVFVRQGAANIGKWLTEEVNMLDDYRAAFDEQPPETATLAIMSDSDNTRERAVAYIDFIELLR